MRGETGIWIIILCCSLLPILIQSAYKATVSAFCDYPLLFARSSIFWYDSVILYLTLWRIGHKIVQ